MQIWYIFLWIPFLTQKKAYFVFTRLFCINTNKPKTFKAHFLSHSLGIWASVLQLQLWPLLEVGFLGPRPKEWLLSGTCPFHAFSRELVEIRDASGSSDEICSTLFHWLPHITRPEPNIRDVSPSYWRALFCTVCFSLTKVAWRSTHLNIERASSIFKIPT